MLLTLPLHDKDISARIFIIPIRMSIFNYIHIWHWNDFYCLNPVLSFLLCSLIGNVKMCSLFLFTLLCDSIYLLPRNVSFPSLFSIFLTRPSTHFPLVLQISHIQYFYMAYTQIYSILVSYFSFQRSICLILWM